MNALQIAQIANMGFTTLMEFLMRKSQGAATSKKEIKAYILTSVSTAQILGKLKVSNQKSFDKAINKMVDSVAEILKYSEWSD